jgi:(p)ppGpp synthase/HD superfamily hydrolase
MLAKLPKELYASKSEQAKSYYPPMMKTEIWQVPAVKVADRIHNLRTMNVWSEEKQEKYRQEARDYFFDLAKSLEKKNILNGKDFFIKLEEEIIKSRIATT